MRVIEIDYDYYLISSTIDTTNDLSKIDYMLFIKLNKYSITLFKASPRLN